MDKNAWKTVYSIELKSEYVDDGDLSSFYKHVYELKDHYGNVCGSYRDDNYARKQARRKYKKLIKLLEKSLMS